MPPHFKLAVVGIRSAAACLCLISLHAASLTAGARAQVDKAARDQVQDLIRKIQDDDPEVREVAAEELRKLGAKSAVTCLAELLKDPNPVVRGRAAYALSLPEIDARAAVPRLIAALDEQNPAALESIVDALAQIGSDASDALPDMRINGPDEPLQMIKGRPEAGVALDKLNEAARDKNPRVRRAACRALGETARLIVYRLLKLDANGKICLDQLSRAMGDPDAEVRAAAATTLGPIGVDAAPYIPRLIELMSDPDKQVRLNAVFSLSQLDADRIMQKYSDVAILLNHGPDDWSSAPGPCPRPAGPVRKAIVPLLMAELQSGDSESWGRAADALGYLGTDAEAATPILMQLWADDTDASASAALALARVGPAGTAAVPEFIKTLRAPARRDRRSIAVWALARFGPAARAAVPLLVQLAGDDDYSLSRDAILAIGKIGPAAKSAAPALVALLRKHEEQASDVADVLGGIGAVILPDLRRALGDEYAAVRKAAVLALGVIGKEAAAALPDLILRLKDADSGVRNGAVLALARIDAGGAVAPPHLKAMLDDKDVEVRRSAVFALGRTGRDAQSTSEALVKSLQDSDSCVREFAVNALGRLGKRARSTLPRLEAALQDRNYYVRVAAKKAIDQLQHE
ncbi:MAG: HEAT repeat domain-containing protein [Planctomycetota bacterium]|nr:HEAT repeat domain-containing protein [Planctomycetota bacterium]